MAEVLEQGEANLPSCNGEVTKDSKQISEEVEVVNGQDCENDNSENLSDCSVSSIENEETSPHNSLNGEITDEYEQDGNDVSNSQQNGLQDDAGEQIDNMVTITLSEGQKLMDANELAETKSKIESKLSLLSNHLREEQQHEDCENQAGLIGDLNDRILTLEKLKEKLETENQDLSRNLKQSIEKLGQHDVAAKRTISHLQQDHDSKHKEMMKRCAALESDKQAAVMNYARREKELLDLRQKKEAAEQFARNAAREREKATAQLKSIKADYNKLKNNLEKKESECNGSKQEIEKLKEEVNSQIIKARWAQNKLKTEVDNHKETKEKCDKMVMEIQQAKEETEQIRRNCQEMIKTYQESEEIKSNALDIELKEKLQLLDERESQTEDLQDLLKQKNEELNLLKIKHKDVFEENNVLKSKVECFEEERLKNEHVLRGYEEVMNKQKLTASEMNEKIESMEQLQNDLEQSEVKVKQLSEDLNEAVIKRDSAIDDLNRKEQREQELLEYTRKVSSKNTELTVQVEELSGTLKQNETELDSLQKEIKQLRDGIVVLTSSEQSAQKESSKYKFEMGTRLEEKEKTVCELLLQMEDLKDELRTQKRKNAASVKDLTRQLNQAKRRMDTNDAVSTSSGRNSNQHSADGGSLGSRTSSTTSLDKICSSTSPDMHCTNQNHSYEPDAIPETTVTGSPSLDRQMLIERIVRLQQIHAKKNEKIDFLTEHVQQLVHEMQRKQRLIQHYIMREEVGSLAPQKSTDPHRQKTGLTLELSMEINQKMQSVLEDTLLKNITLKESLETLGKEVQRLCSQPNGS
uniref:Coiled-coil domain-containing protein 186-like n=1 Tax=Phallusia mammillata TaxID=59560 RepID=A0A6F9D7Z8_9ASCI|nr:coiled-coil domain-containing protein 186-like [Phallusia mammillata]